MNTKFEPLKIRAFNYEFTPKLEATAYKARKRRARRIVVTPKRPSIRR